MSFLRNATNFTIEACSTKASVCKPGLLFPVWQPVDNLSTGDMVARAFVYGLGLAYMFLGVSIISDRFMSAIEVITSQEKEIVVKDSFGEKQVVTVRIWNETVSNLTVSIYFFIPIY
jgi:solute carrier family 8 (sodium/calcium exchanger)